MAKNAFITPTLAVVAGHSAGHILPARTLAQEWLAHHPKSKVLFFSTDKKLDTALLSEKNDPIIHIPITLTNISLRQWWRIPAWSIKLIQTCFQSYHILSYHRVTKLITTGGSLAIPLCIAAKLRRIPIELYELNVVPGKAVRLLSGLTHNIYLCFAQAQKYFKHTQCTIIPYPLQPTLRTQQNRPEQSRANLGLHPEYTTILILGGSQGSLFINNLIKQWVPYAAKQYANIQIIHQTGAQDRTDWNSFYKSYNLPAVSFAYHTAIHELYNAADSIICRSGAGTLFEIMHYKKKCITIPLEGLAGNHQLLNARAIAEQHPDLVHILSQQKLKNDISLLVDTLHDMIISTMPTTNQSFLSGQSAGAAPKP